MAFIEGKIVSSRRTVKTGPAAARESAPAPTASSSSPQQPMSTSLIGNEVEIYTSYAQKFLRRGGPIDLALQEVQLSDLMMAATTKPESGPIFHQAFLSFAFINFGSQHKQTEITGRGYAICGVAMRELNQALSDPNRRTGDDVFHSVLTLALLECCVPSGPKHYVKHMIALEKILELRNPTSSSDCSSRLAESYKSVRHMILFASLRTGNASILARAEWKTFLRAQCPAEELKEQDLYDILADCTVLTEQRNEISAERSLDLEKSTHQRDQLKHRATMLLSNLHTWKEQWNNDAINSYSENPVTWGDGSLSLLTSLEFANASSAAQYMLFNTALIHVLRLLVSLPYEPKHTDKFPSQSLQGTLQEARRLDHLWKLDEDDFLSAERRAALEIYRCTPFDLDQKARAGRCISPIGHWAVTTAWATLGDIDSPEGKWMMELLGPNSPEAIAITVWDK
jgi:hypothetical protein